MAGLEKRQKSAELFDDENWVEVEPGYWENYSLSDDIPSIYHDEELDGTGNEYIVQFNGAETMRDDMYTESFGSLSTAVDYAESMLQYGRLV